MNVVGISGSPSSSSRSAALLRLAQQRLDTVAATQHSIPIRTLPSQPLLEADTSHPGIASALQQVQAADVVLVSTPIYKAAYSGLLKLFLDLLPQDGLRGKTVLPLATGGSTAHLLALDYTLKPVLGALGARDILDPVYATDAQFSAHGQHGHVPDDAIAARVDRSLHALLVRCH